MAENNAPEVKLNENPEGTVSFATDVVATIAGLAANEVEGVAGMTGASSSLADILTRKNTRNYTRGVKVDIENNMVKVDVTIVVEYGSPVPDVAHNIQENVKKAIETMSGLDVRNVDVHVQGVSFEPRSWTSSRRSSWRSPPLPPSRPQSPRPKRKRKRKTTWTMWTICRMFPKKSKKTGRTGIRSKAEAPTKEAKAYEDGIPGSGFDLFVFVDRRVPCGVGGPARLRAGSGGNLL